MISICITCKNRSKLSYHNNVEVTPLPNLVDSLVEIFEGPFIEDTELVISDWMSTDWPLREWLPPKLDGVIPHRIVDVKSKNFSRGKGRNIAFEFARGDKIFFLDTDMLVLSPRVIISGISAVTKGAVYFPICLSYYDHQHLDGWWRTTGFGNMMATRKQLRKVGKWQDKKTWGGEDEQMFIKMARNFPISRKKTPGLYHQWHPESEKHFNKPGFFKRMFCK